MALTVRCAKAAARPYVVLTQFAAVLRFDSVFGGAHKERLGSRWSYDGSGVLKGLTLKTTCIVQRDNPTPPAKCRNHEVAAFTFLLQAPSTRAVLARLGVTIQETFQLVHNSKGDDTPDIEALGLRWEHTWYRPIRCRWIKFTVRLGRWRSRRYLGPAAT